MYAFHIYLAWYEKVFKNSESKENNGGLVGRVFTNGPGD